MTAQPEESVLRPVPKLIAREGVQLAFNVTFPPGSLAHLHGQTVYGPVAPGEDYVPLGPAIYMVKLRYERRRRKPARLWAQEYKELTLQLVSLIPTADEEQEAIAAEREAARRIFTTTKSWKFSPVWRVSSRGVVIAGVELVGLNLLVSPTAALAAEALAEAALRAATQPTAASDGPTPAQSEPLILVKS